MRFYLLLPDIFLDNTLSELNKSIVTRIEVEFQFPKKKLHFPEVTWIPHTVPHTRLYGTYIYIQAEDNLKT